MVIKNENCDSHYLPLRVLSHPADSRSIDREGRFDHLVYSKDV
jgi:hypothetical protein